MDTDHPSDTQPAAPAAGPERSEPAAGWHETAAVLAGRHDADPVVVCAMLEHAAVGLLHQPAATDTGGHYGMLLVDQAVAEIALATGDSGPPPAGVGTDQVHAADVRPLLAAAAELLAGCEGSDTDVLAYARAISFVRQALDAIPPSP